MARAPVVINTPFPSSDEVADMVGLSQAQRKKVFALVDRIVAERLGSPSTRRPPARSRMKARKRRATRS
jgi:hypothetical protein